MNCQCGQPGTRLIAAVAYCERCAEAILTPIRECFAEEPEREPTLGIGIQAGPLRPDWHDGWADLECDVCEATWVGPLGEECAYCLRWLELANQVQRDRLLRPDLPDVDDARYEQAIQAWSKRLVAAVLEEIITRHEAAHAWRRQVPDVAV